jgi:hypothetical protein
MKLPTNEHLEIVYHLLKHIKTDNRTRAIPIPL